MTQFDSVTRQAAPAAGQPDSEAENTVLLLHGIRTFGRWPQRLQRLLRQQGIDSAIYHYGRVGAVVFLLPGVRHILVLLLRRFLRRNAERWHDQRVHVVAHSFGTYLITEALRGLPADQGPRIDTLILTGSVLEQHFSWQEFVGPDRRIRRVINECGERDPWPTMAQLFVISMGVGGRYGFQVDAGLHGRLYNRYFPTLGHNDFFTDSLMRERWLHLLRGAEPEAWPATRPQPRWSAALEPWSEPFKWLFWLLLVAAIAWSLT